MSNILSKELVLFYHQKSPEGRLQWILDLFFPHGHIFVVKKLSEKSLVITISTNSYCFEFPGRKTFGFLEWKVLYSKIKNDILKIKNFFLSGKFRFQIFLIHLDLSSKFRVTVKQWDLSNIFLLHFKMILCKQINSISKSHTHAYNYIQNILSIMQWSFERRFKNLQPSHENVIIIDKYLLMYFDFWKHLKILEHFGLPPVSYIFLGFPYGVCDHPLKHHLCLHTY